MLIRPFDYALEGYMKKAMKLTTLRRELFGNAQPTPKSFVMQSQHPVTD